MYPWLSQGFIVVYTLSSIIRLSNTLYINGTALYQVIDFNQTHVIYLIRFNLNTTYGPLTLSEEKILPLNDSFSLPFLTNATLNFFESRGLKCSGSVCYVKLTRKSEDVITYYNITVDKRLMLVRELEEKTLLFRDGKVIGESKTLLRLTR